MAVNIMIQGTMSNAGKSLIAAGLCRVFMQDGYRVAPFKSQNMALNSYITDEGLEMGRAQVVQAEACGKKPSVLMNPILLKPTTDVGSQVIVNGRSRGNMKAADYFRRKKELIPDIMEAYNRLAAENDIIVIEGAGSPAEINLKADDIVNMGLAEMLDAPVLLVGDIDRGGVFAQLAGTMMLLEEKEKQRVKAFIINKFRGDVDILRPGLEMIEDICKRPVAGVIPYADIDIDDEDSLTERFKRNAYSASEPDIDAENAQLNINDSRKINICVIRLPRISNFSDFSILEALSGVDLIYADSPQGLEDADIIIIPGTKSTISDLQWLKRRGIGNAVIRAARSGIPVIGICGGYQMLGEKIIDMTGAETDEAFSEADGLALLPVITEFEEEKETVQTDATVCESDDLFSGLGGTELKGYEIHMGSTRIISKDARRFASVRGAQRRDGCVRGNVIGTYLHGLLTAESLQKNCCSWYQEENLMFPILRRIRNHSTISLQT